MTVLHYSLTVVRLFRSLGYVDKKLFTMNTFVRGTSNVSFNVSHVFMGGQGVAQDVNIFRFTAYF